MPGALLNRRERLVDWLIRGRYVLFPAVLVLLAAAWPVSQRLEYDRSIESLYTADGCNKELRPLSTLSTCPVTAPRSSTELGLAA
ncbi:MAG TPA: hypothetical protein VML55_06095 [Planctomycetaceae bacterium]|nr:hypothetical protein [Planctomycetaceae bacterium]